MFDEEFLEINELCDDNIDDVVFNTNNTDEINLGSNENVFEVTSDNDLISGTISQDTRIELLTDENTEALSLETNQYLEEVEEINPQSENSLENLIEKCTAGLSNNIIQDLPSFDSEKSLTRVGYTQPNIFGGYDYYQCFSGKSRVSPALFSNLVLDTAKDIFNSLTDEVIPGDLKDK